MPDSAKAAPDGDFHNQEIFAHYKKYDIGMIRETAGNMSVNLPTALGKIQNLLNEFYMDHPAKIVPGDNLDLNDTLSRQLDSDYIQDKRRKTSLGKLRETQIPRLIKNAPNIFELHLAMARGLQKAEKSGIVFTKSPFKSAFHYLTALRYRSLKLSPEIWLDKERLELLNNTQEKTDADNYNKNFIVLTQSRRDYEQVSRKLFVDEDNRVSSASDPGEDTFHKENQKALSVMMDKINSMEESMKEQTRIYEGYAENYNRESSRILLELANLVISVEDTIRDKEKILNSVEDYRGNYNSVFKQNWRLQSRRAAYINLLESASLLDQKNPNTPMILAGEYKSAGEHTLAISSLEKSLTYNDNAGGKALTDDQLADIYMDLGGLYSVTRRFVDAAYYYEKAYAHKNSEQLAFLLGKMHTDHTGNYTRAKELFEKLDASASQPGISLQKGDVNDPVKAIAQQKYNYVVASYLSQIYEKIGLEKQQLEMLKKTVSIHSGIESLISEQYRVLRDKEKISIENRLKFNREPGENNMQTYYQKQQNYEDQKNILQNLEIVRKSLNFKESYFNLAYRYELNHNIESAIDTYRIAESYGLGPDEARREILRLQMKYFK